MKLHEHIYGRRRGIFVVFLCRKLVRSLKFSEVYSQLTWIWNKKTDIARLTGAARSDGPTKPPAAN